MLPTNEMCENEPKISSPDTNATNANQNDETVGNLVDEKETCTKDSSAVSLKELPSSEDTSVVKDNNVKSVSEVARLEMTENSPEKTTPDASTCSREASTALKRNIRFLDSSRDCKSDSECDFKESSPKKIKNATANQASKLSPSKTESSKCPSQKSKRQPTLHSFLGPSTQRSRSLTTLTPLPAGRRSPDCVIVSSSKPPYATRGASVSDMRERSVLMSRDDKRKEYTCGDKYVTLETVDKWSKYYAKNAKRLKILKPTDDEILKFISGEKRFAADENLNAKISLFQGNITYLEIDAVVNAANKLDNFDRVVFCLFGESDVRIYERWIQVYFPVHTVPTKSSSSAS